MEPYAAWMLHQSLHGCIQFIFTHFNTNRIRLGEQYWHWKPSAAWMLRQSLHGCIYGVFLGLILLDQT
ncbi:MULTISPECIES: hypothetical protein [Alteromonas]|uniref:hypothetical protein n=1 Tax=Alteromonas TaxID=226 RepID=UPI000F869690|nr:MULTISPECIES: hypothetical protein [Alteromonas]MBO7923635.1 hypothetical protein [Alteromonas sp. K632G]